MRPVSRLECARSQAPSSRADVRGLPRRIAPAGQDRVELGEQTMPPPLSRMADHNPTVLVARAREHVAARLPAENPATASSPGYFHRYLPPTTSHNCTP